ncbi:hypothetical protein N7533_008004 [Penicillium manginii]|uniref:uncharacterized protein n=1 Tax=Penicillium manginii TaxID=203109 RepID=UPI0025483FE5|nr:uncharacterized protein N7533_008004 [Penicillium manginii]KAJ5750976.1 hypothetical protein N7533_008004 [Penicillium manginii]
MPSTPLQPPDHPIALRHSHLLAPAPDRLTNTPTTLTVTRENTQSSRLAFTIAQLRKDEPLDSLRRSTLLYTVSGRAWSNSQHREIRDVAGRPLLELRRIWWRGQWIVKRAGGVGEELLCAEMRWAIGMKIGARFCNALVAGREGMALSRGARGRGPSPGPGTVLRATAGSAARSLSRSRPRTAVPASGPGSTSASAAAAAAAAASAERTATATATTTAGPGPGPGPGPASIYNRPTPTRRRTISNYPHAPPIARDAPPPYSAEVAAGHATHENENNEAEGENDPEIEVDDSTASNTPSAASSSTSLSSADSDNKSRSTVLPSYESVRRMRRDSHHSLRDLLDAIEPPREPAPASAAPYPTQRRWSESCIDPRVELRVVQASSTVAEVMMGERKIVHVKRGRVLDVVGSGRRTRWEVEIAEGVDLLLAVCIVLIIAESQSVRHENR